MKKMCCIDASPGLPSRIQKHNLILRVASLGLFLMLCLHKNALSQNVGIGTSLPGFPLNFSNSLGDKISLYGNTGNHYGLGVQGGLLQIHSDAANASIAFGYGSSSTFLERMRILNAGTDGMILNGRLLLKNGSLPLDVNQTPGVWLYKADNSGLLGFMGTQNNQNIGFYGGPANGGWGFTYDGLTSRVGIGTSNPTSSLNVNGQITVDQKNFGGYGGLLLKGNVPGSNYPNIAFTIKNNAATPSDVVAAMVQGDLVSNSAGSETIDLTFLTSNSGLGGLSEKMRIKNNGNIGIGTPNPNAPLGFAPLLGKKITLYPGANGDAGFGVFGNELRIASDYFNADVTVGFDDRNFGFTERMRVKGNGNVGIGNNNPVNKLDVNGSVNITGPLKINGSTGSAGQVLQSNANAAPTWKAKPYFLTLQQQGDENSFIRLIGIGVYSLPIPAMDNQTIFIPEAGKVLVNITGSFYPYGLPTVASGKIWVEIWETATNTLKLKLLAKGYANGYDGATLNATNLIDLNAGFYLIRASFSRTHDTFSGDSQLSQAKLIMQVFPN